MTPEQYQTAKAQLEAVDTELAALDQQVRDYIDKAREFNHARAVASSKRTELSKSAQPLRETVAAVEAEMRRIAAEKAQAEAAERERLAAEKAVADRAAAERALKDAAEKAEQSELAQLRARVAELEAAKG